MMAESFHSSNAVNCNIPLIILIACFSINLVGFLHVNGKEQRTFQLLSQPPTLAAESRKESQTAQENNLSRIQEKFNSDASYTSLKEPFQQSKHLQPSNKLRLVKFRRDVEQELLYNYQTAQDYNVLDNEFTRPIEQEELLEESSNSFGRAEALIGVPETDNNVTTITATSNEYNSTSSNGTYDRSSEVERLVRGQIELAASNWAAAESNTEIPVDNLRTDNDLVSQLTNYTSQGTLETLASQSDRQLSGAASSLDTPFKDKFYPNHNYIFDNNANSPFLPVTDLDSSQSSTANGNGLESTGSFSSDESNVTESAPPPQATIGAGDLISKLRHSYHSRGPITSDSFSPHHIESQSPTSRPRNQASAAIAKAFQRLDKSRTHTPSDNGHQIYPDSSLPVVSNSPPALNGSANYQQQDSSHSLLGGANISPKGFNDSPMPAPASSNGQQAVDATKVVTTKFIDFPIELLTVNDNTDRIHTLSTATNRNQSPNKLASVTAATKNSATAVGRDSSLATRINAHRFKNRELIDRKQKETSDAPIDERPSASSQAEPLTLTVQRKTVLDKVQKFANSFSIATTGRPTPSQTTPLRLEVTSPVFQRRGQTIQRTTLPLTNNVDSIQTPTTIIVPASTTTLGTSVAPPTASLAPIPFLSASNNNRATSNQSTLLNGRPAHHHHLHSHVHSIKPALISIPIPVQSKFNGYDSLVAAAAAAAAAATASAARTRASSGQQQTSLPAGGATIQGPLSRKLHLTTANTIPIGGTLASMQSNTLGGLQQKVGPLAKKGHKSNGVASQPSSSIFGQLIGSANKALKQVTGGSLFNLQASSSNQAAPVYSNPNVGKTMIPIIYPHHSLFTNRGGIPSVGDSSSLDSLIHYPSGASSSQDSDGFNGLNQAQLESLGLAQAPADEIPPFDAYLAAFLNAAKSNEEDIGGYSLSEPKPIPSEVILSAIGGADHDNKQQSNLDWPATNNNGNNSPNSSESEVVFASLGDNPNFLYPLLAGKQSNIPGQYITGGLEELQSNFLNAFDGEPQAAMGEISSGAQTSDLVSANTPKATTVSATTPRPSPKSTSNNSNKKKQATSGPKLTTKAKVLQHVNPDGGQQQWQYALSHYLSDELRKLENRKPGSSENVPVYLVSNSKLGAGNIQANSAKFSQPFRNADLISIDEFRPISNPQYYLNLPDNSKFYDHIDSNEETRKPAIINLSAASVNQAQNQAISQFGKPVGHKYAQHNQGSTIKSSSIRGHVFDELHQNKNRFIIGSRLPIGGATQVGSAANNIRQLPANSLIQLLPHQHVLHNDDLIQHALIHAGSSLKPHIMAASDLINYHKQHLSSHHNHSPLHLFGQSSSANANYHQPQDMATSETARFAVTSTSRGSLLLHFWPLALALLPLMIIVAIVAQLVMVAPLIMFAMATLSISRFAAALVGPFGASHSREETGNSILMNNNKTDHMALAFPSHSFLTSVLRLTDKYSNGRYNLGPNSTLTTATTAQPKTTTDKESKQRIKRALDH